MCVCVCVTVCVCVCVVLVISSLVGKGKLHLHFRGLCHLCPQKSHSEVERMKHASYTVASSIKIKYSDQPQYSSTRTIISRGSIVCIADLDNNLQ